MFPLYDTNPHRRVPWLTLALIAVNVAISLWMFRQPEPRQHAVYARYGFVPQRIKQLSDPELNVKVKLTADDQAGPGRAIVLEARPDEIITSLFSMMFLHGNLLHLLSNMWFLWIFGNNIEDRLGHFIYLAFYLLGGLLALACHWATQPDSAVPVIGASGAVAAVLGAYLVTYPRAKVRTLLVLIVFVTVIDLPAVLVLGFWFLQQLLSGLQLFVPFGQDVSGGVAWWAHVGGFVAGVVLMPLLALGAPPPDEDWKQQADDQFAPLDH